MKSTIKVSISGIAFNLEDDAYQLLKNYLDELTVHFSKDEGGKEIIEDIEARLAELLLAKINAPEQAVTAKNVAEVIDILGKPEDLNDGSSTNASSNTPYPPPVAARKRLYRDPDNQVVAGVCGGLGVYFNADPVIFRILFVALTISSPFLWFLNFGAAAAIAYAVLWICVPRALTMAQKLEMLGESPSVANIERKMREEALKSPAQARPKRAVLGNVIRAGFYVLSAMITIPIICVGIALVVAFIAVAFAGGWFLQDSVFPLMDFVAIAGTNLTLIKILALIALAIPLMLLVYAAIRLLFRFKAKSKGIVISLVTIWILCIFGLFGIGGYALKDYRSGAKKVTEQTFTIASDTLYIAIPQDFSKNNDRFYIGWNSDDHHPHIPYLWINEQKDVMSVFPEVDIYYVDDSTFNISYTCSARAKNKAIAQQKVEEVPVQYSVTDSLITLTPHQFTKEHRWSGELGRLVIHAPKSKKVVLNDDLGGDVRYHHEQEYNLLD